MELPPGQLALPLVVATAEYTTVNGDDVGFTRVCTGIVVVPAAVAPVIPVGTFAVQLMVTFGVGELNVTTAVGELEQMV